MNGGDRLVGLIEQGVAAQNLHARGHGSGHRVVVALVLLVGSRLAWPWLAGHTFHPEGEARKECFHPCLSGLTESGKVASLRTQLLRTTFKVGLGAAQREGTSLPLQASHRFRVSHRAPRVRPLRPRELARESETYELATSGSGQECR